MPKAVLIMDMPERCDKCLLLLKLPQKDGLALCLARQKNGQEEYNPKHKKTWRPDWCPLVELPEKNPNNPELRPGVYYRGDAYEVYKNGFNACLNEILK